MSGRAERREPRIRRQDRPVAAGNELSRQRDRPCNVRQRDGFADEQDPTAGVMTGLNHRQCILPR